MKLIGVEVRNFARFEKQFIPLSLGINVLAGKNNSGKTAALSALQCLSALAFTDHRPIPDGLAPYCHDGRSFAFDLICQIEAGDPHLLVSPKVNLKDLLFGGQATLGLSFSVDAVQRTITFVGGSLVVHDGVGERHFPTIVRTQSEVRQITYNYETSSDANVPSVIATHRGSINGQELLSFVEKTPYIDIINGVRSVKRITQHRVPVASMNLNTVEDLSADARDMPAFLNTLITNNPDVFDELQAFMISVFPEFTRLKAPSHNNLTSIALIDRKTNREIPLTHCGTGVEQMLILAAFLMTSRQHAVILLDEPHSYLHPTAERALMRFLYQFPQNRIVISTHSSAIINAVSPDRVTHIGSFETHRAGASTSAILHDLGYLNSDLLFHDQLIFVEGPSDRGIMPILLAKEGRVSGFQIDRTGFPVMDGSGRLTAKVAEHSILNYERLLEALGTTEQAHVYVFDGDKRNEYQAALQRLRPTGKPLDIRFLPRMELENFLLEENAICSALIQEASLYKLEVSVTAEQIARHLKDELRKTNDPELFPQGADSVCDLIKVKGSVLLERLYNSYNMVYSKTASGRLIASNLPESFEPLHDVVATVHAVFDTA